MRHFYDDFYVIITTIIQRKFGIEHIFARMVSVPLFRCCIQQGIEQQLVCSPRLTSELWFESKQDDVTFAIGQLDHGRFTTQMFFLTKRPSTHKNILFGISRHDIEGG